MWTAAAIMKLLSSNVNLLGTDRYMILLRISNKTSNTLPLMRFCVVWNRRISHVKKICQGVPCSVAYVKFSLSMEICAWAARKCTGIFKHFKVAEKISIFSFDLGDPQRVNLRKVTHTNMNLWRIRWMASRSFSRILRVSYSSGHFKQVNAMNRHYSGSFKELLYTSEDELER